MHGARAAWALVVAGAALAAGWWSWQSADRPASPTLPTSPPARAFQPQPDAQVFATYAGSESCRECHATAYTQWSTSHHALAERPVNSASDRAAFAPTRQIRHGSQSSEARLGDSALELVTAGPATNSAAYRPEFVIGVDPLRQFIVPAEGGRWQVTELAFDPRKAEWFDVYGEEDRRPGEWGHWTGRGMTWNMMCASCHNVRVHKNYDAPTDVYATRLAERGVGCEACHGPMRAHSDWQRQHRGGGVADPTLKRFSRDQVLDTCGSCHARRGELTGDFQPGDDFFDHFTLAIPDESDVFHPDGQVREENYEFTSFLSSRMWAAGVRCLDCHAAHSAKPLLAGDSLCLRCHETPVPPAPRIDPRAHSHHAPGTPGSHCVDCHMPLTTYMQRHPRRDHGFTIPDPWLTKTHGIPNACDRCHADRGTPWMVDAAEKWYGARLQRPARRRAQWVTQARTNQPGVHTNLLKLAGTEPLPLWRASVASLLGAHAHEPVVTSALLGLLRDTNALVRAAAARSLEGPARAGQPEVLTAMHQLLNDPIRFPRIEAAWRLRTGLDTNSAAGQDLLHSITLNADQPAGLLQQSQWHLDRGHHASAIADLERALAWDRSSPPLHHALALALNAAGRPHEAVSALREACRLAPRDAHLRYTLALGLAEAGQTADATIALEETVKLDPLLARAWYNLGLGYAGQERLDQALEALARAQELDPRSPDPPYARATVLARLGRPAEARAAADQTLRLQPNHSEATALLRTLPRGP